MLLWIFIALLTGAAVMAVLMPLGRAPRAVAAADRERRVYLAQLDELERDKSDGRIGADEAGAARAEIARRLIAADGDRGEAILGGGPGARRVVALVALVGVPVFSLAVYLGLGAPGLVGQPLAARLSALPQADDIQLLVAKVEEHLAREPEDGRGWDVIAPVYLRLGRAEDAARAFRNAVRLEGSTAKRQTGLGEAILALQDGIVTAEARAAFEAALAHEPTTPGPRFFLALAAEQEGKREAAAAGWRALLQDSPADAPWRGAVEESLARVDAPAAPGPNAEQVAAARDMTPEARTAMIEGMVEGLAERLKAEPGDVEGWLRLIRSYAVLGRTDAAANAARDALAGVKDAAARGRVEALIADLGVTPAATALP